MPGNWRYRPKWNGKRILCHLPTLRTWNRELEENTSSTAGKPAFIKLKEIVESGDLWPPVLEWMDLEFIWGRHSVGKGMIIVLDYVSENETWTQRMVNLAMAFSGSTPLDVYAEPQKDEVHISRFIGPDETLKHWVVMQELNKDFGATFFEGLVGYETESKYPIQLFSPKRETRHWMKYRFIT